jgi:hypothetical protein
MSELKPKGKLGGKRQGAGRKPNYLKRLGVTPVNAAQIMARYDEHEAGDGFLKHPSPSIRLQAWQYLTDRRDGKPKQAVDISGNLNHTHTAYRDPRLAGSSGEELAALECCESDEPCRKKLERSWLWYGGCPRARMPNGDSDRVYTTEPSIIRCSTTIAATVLAHVS